MRAFDPFSTRTRCHAASTSVVGCGWPFTSTRSPRKPFIISIMPPPWIDELVARVEPAILQHAQELGVARGQRQRVLFGIAHQEQARQALVHLRARSHVRMRVVPVGARAIGDLEVVDVLATGADGQPRMAVGGLGHIQAVPVDDRVFRRAGSRSGRAPSVRGAAG